MEVASIKQTTERYNLDGSRTNKEVRIDLARSL